MCKIPLHLRDCQTECAKLPCICTIAKSNVQNSSASERLPNRMCKTPRHLHDYHIECSKLLCICTIAKPNVQNSPSSERLQNRMHKPPLHLHDRQIECTKLPVNMRIGMWAIMRRGEPCVRPVFVARCATTDSKAGEYKIRHYITLH